MRYIHESELKHLRFNEEAIALAILRQLLRRGILTPADVETIAVDLEDLEAESGSTNRPHQVRCQTIRTARYRPDESGDDDGDD